MAHAKLAHSVHVEVNGLQSHRDYFYQFDVRDEESPVGRFRTAPAGTAVEEIHFAFASCQDFQNGFYTAYEHMTEEDLDLVVFLGDYIYEDRPDPSGVRQHTGTGEPVTLDEYRARHALYRSDRALQAAHAPLHGPSPSTTTRSITTGAATIRRIPTSSRSKLF